jgi:hypothetical protein
MKLLNSMKKPKPKEKKRKGIENSPTINHTQEIVDPPPPVVTV